MRKVVAAEYVKVGGVMQDVERAVNTRHARVGNRADVIYAGSVCPARIIGSPDSPQT